MSDEFERIARLKQRFQSLRGHGIVLGIGDDAAVLSGSENCVLSVDTAVESVHFEREFAPLQVLAARAFSAALSDLAAMAASPCAALCSLVLPAELGEAEFDAIIEGLAIAAANYDCPIVGGNLAAGRELSLTTTVIGRLQGSGLLRSGAHAGDRICVTGSLGSAALGLLLLQRGAAALGPEAVGRWRTPRARIREGLQLRGIASAAIDVSDGALQDLGHLCEASELGAEIRVADLPLESGFSELARELGHDPLRLALLGGEDYELIYTVPESSPVLGPGHCIGRMTYDTGKLKVLDEQGRELRLEGRGYGHFRK